MNPAQFKDKVASGKRRTVPFTDEAIDNLKKLCDQLSDNEFKISQFEMINLVMESADVNDTKLASAVAAMKKVERERVEKEKILRERVAQLTPEELAKALALLGK